MSSVADKLGKLLENAFKKAFNREESGISACEKSTEESSFIHTTIQEYKEAGHHYRRTKDQMSRGLTREEAFEEFKKTKNKL